MSLFEAGPKKKTKDQEAYDAEHKMLMAVADALKTSGVIAFIADVREGGMTKMLIRGVPNFTVTAAAGTLYSNGTEKHHEVTVNINGRSSMTIDVYDASQFDIGASETANNIMQIIRADEEQSAETGGDAAAVVEELKAQGFEKTVHYTADPMPDGWVATMEWHYWFKSKVAKFKEGDDQVMVDILWKNNNKQETRKSAKVIRVPKEGGADFVWEQFEIMCEGIKPAMVSENANKALDELCKRPSTQRRR